VGTRLSPILLSIQLVMLQSTNSRFIQAILSKLLGSQSSHSSHPAFVHGQHYVNYFKCNMLHYFNFVIITCYLWWILIGKAALDT